MNHGDIRWYTFALPDKRRPVLILTRTSAIQFLNSVTVAPVTTTIRDIPTELLLDQEDGMFTECAVNLDNLQTVPKSNIGGLITALRTDQMMDVQEAISFALEFDWIAI